MLVLDTKICRHNPKFSLIWILGVVIQVFTPDLEVRNLFLRSTPLSTKFILLINVKMPHLLAGYMQHLRVWKQEKSFLYQHFIFNEQLKFHAQMSSQSMKYIFITLGQVSDQIWLDNTWRNALTLNASIATKVVCFSRLLKCLRSLYGKQCGPRSDCLFWVHALCFYT